MEKISRVLTGLMLLLCGMLLLYALLLGTLFQMEHRSYLAALVMALFPVSLWLLLSRKRSNTPRCAAGRRPADPSPAGGGRRDLLGFGAGAEPGRSGAEPGVPGTLSPYRRLCAFPWPGAARFRPEPDCGCVLQRPCRHPQRSAALSSAASLAGSGHGCARFPSMPVPSRTRFENVAGIVPLVSVRIG